MIPIILWALVGLIGGVQSKCSLTPIADDERSIAYACIHGDLSDLNELSSETEWIEFSVSRFQYLPDDAFWRFKNLKRLAFYNCHFAGISDHAFRRLDRLEWLVFHGTRLNIARAAWFQHLHNLRRLIMDRCNIVHIEPAVYPLLRLLETLGLRDNDLDCLPIEGLALLRSLRTIRIDGNPWICECRQRLESFFRERQITQEEQCRACAPHIYLQCMTQVEIPIFQPTYPQIYQRPMHGHEFQTSFLSSLDRLPDTTTWIEINGLLLEKIPRYTFFRFGNSLRSLELRDCEVNSIESGAFAGLNKLERLILIGNRFPVIVADWFKDLYGLQQLILAGNEIEHIERTAFWSLADSLRYLDLRNNRLTCLAIEDLSELKKLERFEGIGNTWRCKCRNNLISYFTNQHIGYEISNGRCDENITYVQRPNNGWRHRQVTTGTVHWGSLEETISYYNITSELRPRPRPPIQFTTPIPEAPTIVPGGTCTPKDNSVQYYSCSGITSLYKLDTIPYRVHTIRIMRSRIVTIPSQSFTRFGHYLRILEFHDCSIKKIDNHAFWGLNNLEHLVLRSNALESITAECLDGLPRLRHLDLSRNHIYRISNGVFDMLPHLATLDISENNMNCIGVEYMASRLKHLRDLTVTGNPWSCLCGAELIRFLEDHRIPYDRDSLVDQSEQCHDKTVFPMIYPPATTVRTTTITYPAITLEPTYPTISRTPEGNCTSHEEAEGIRYKCHGGNIYLLETLPDKIGAIEFQEGHLPHLPFEVFKRFSEVHEIIIRNCGLRTIEPGAFNHLHKLERLTIRDNPLLTVGSSWFILENLEALDLRGNSIRYIEPGAFKHLPKLLYLNLEGNDLKCIFTSDLGDMQKIHVIEFSGNPLKWRCRTELEQFLETRHINYVKVENSCEGKKIVRNLLLQNTTYDCAAGSTSNGVQWKSSFIITFTIVFFIYNILIH
ncbi:slit homolog 2 protein-like [Prorops nasuta]|uniref:slit homolog 2 protein-like n=1 Tax=Prorops nasuta TaxID=863751 RepID=UPI0034CE6486